MGTLQCTPECSCCPGLGCHTGSQQAGAVWLGLRMGVPAPSRGTEEEQTVTRECWETGLPSVPALPHPQAQGWLSMTFWDQGPSSKSEGGATAPSFSPSWLPSNANSPWLGESLDPRFWGMNTPLAAQGVAGAFPGRMSGHGHVFCRFLVAIGLDVGQGWISRSTDSIPRDGGLWGDSLRLLEPSDPQHVGIEGDGKQPPAAPCPAPVV